MTKQHKYKRGTCQDEFMKSLPGTVAEIYKKSELGRTTVLTLSRQLHAIGKIHISGWQLLKSHSVYFPTFAAGAGTDVEKPVLLPKLETLELPKAARKKKLEDTLDEIIEKEINKARIEARQNADMMAKRTSPFPSTFMRAIQCNHYA